MIREEKIRVVHVYPRLTCGGIERVIEDMIRFADRNRFSFAILTQEEGDNEDVFHEMGVDILRVPFGGNKGDYNSRLQEFFEGHRFDVVHSHMHHQMMHVNKAAKKAGVKCRVAHSHINHPDWPWWKRLLRIPKFMLHNAGATDLVGCSQGALDWLFPLRRGGKVILNGIDTEKYKYTDNRRCSARKALGIPPYRKVVLNIGRLTTQKNQNFILDIAKLLRGEESIEFIIVGEGPLHEQLRDRLEVEQLSNVRLLGERRDVPDLLCAADLFILPSLYEGFPVVINEALTAGLPVAVNENLDLRGFRRDCEIYPMSLGNIGDWVEKVKHSYPSAPLSDAGRGQLNRYVNCGIDARKMAKECTDLYIQRLSAPEK